MEYQRIAVDAGSVTIGMYVSMLDRPWLETPFIFQGFEVKAQDEIDMLQRHCNWVYVDIERSSLPQAQFRHLIQAQRTRRQTSGHGAQKAVHEPGRWLLMLRRWLARFGLRTQQVADRTTAETGYPILSTVRGEAPDAQAAYTQLAQQHARAVERASLNNDVNIAALRRAVRPAVESVLRNPDAMAWTVFSRKRRRENNVRAIGTAVWCMIFGRHLCFDRQQIEELALGGLLLDIGYVRLSQPLQETRGELTPEQKLAMTSHVQLGEDIVARSNGVPDAVIEMVSCHHERADGSGYPQGLQGMKIPAYGRIAGIADAYDAMTTENTYSPAYSAYDAARTLNELRDKHFAAEVVEQFLKAIGMFPTASIVELSDGTVGVVLEQNRSNALKPKVMVLAHKDKGPLSQSKIIELRDLPVDVTHSNAVWIVAGHEHGAFGIDPISLFRG